MKLKSLNEKNDTQSFLNLLKNIQATSSTLGFPSNGNLLDGSLERLPSLVIPKKKGKINVIRNGLNSFDGDQGRNVQLKMQNTEENEEDAFWKNYNVSRSMIQASIDLPFHSL